MENAEPKRDRARSSREWATVGIGVGLGLLFWVVDAVVDAVVFDDGTLLEQLFEPTPLEIWVRTAVLILFIAFGFYARRSLIQRRRAEAALLERTRLFALDAEVGQVLNRDQEFKTLLQGCAEALVRHLDAAFARIWTLNSGEQVLELKASAGMYTHLDGRHSRVAVGQFKIGMIAADKKPHLTNTVIGDPRVHDQEWAKREGMVAFAGYPLLRGEEVVGVMAIFSHHPLTDITLKMLATVADRITVAVERHRATEALRALARRVESILSSAGEGIYGLDRDGKTTFVNPAAAEMLGYNAEELLGGSMHAMVHHTKPDGAPYRGEDCLICAAFRDGTVHRVDTEVLWRKDGTSFPVEYTSTPIWDQGCLTGAVVTFREITERKRAEQALRESEERTIAALRQSDTLKTALLSSVSHELKTPLAAIKVAVSTLHSDGGMVSPAVRDELLGGVTLEIDALSRLVDNLLDMSRIEAGVLKPKYEEYLFEELLEGALRRFSRELQSRKLELNLPTDLPPILVDGVQIQHVLVNLLDNAMKYSAESSAIQINVRANGKALEVRVVSIGETISHKDLTRIFERFYRAPVQRHRPIRGSGLGLAICRGFVEAHGGRIWAESTSGKVNTITFSLPLSYVASD